MRGGGKKECEVIYTGEEEEEGRPNRMLVEATEAKVTWHLCCVNY